MRNVYLFNANHKSLPNSYGDQIRDLMLGCGVIQNSSQRVVIRVGDLLVHRFVESHGELIEKYEQLFFSTPSSNLNELHIRSCMGVNRVYAWTVSGLDRYASNLLHESLSSKCPYLGMQEVKHRIRIHKSFYQLKLLLMCVIKGRECELNAEPDDGYRRKIEALGFSKVSFDLRYYDGR